MGGDRLQFLHYQPLMKKSKMNNHLKQPEKEHNNNLQIYCWFYTKYLMRSTVLELN